MKMPTQHVVRNLDPQWTGSADKLVEEFARVVGEEAPTGQELDFNVRQLRHYQTIEAVARPRRVGKEAVYGYHHLLQALVIKTLLLEGWPLQKITEITRTASQQELLDLLPMQSAAQETQTPYRNRAQQLVEQYARQSNVADASAPYAASTRSATGRKRSGAGFDSGGGRLPRGWRSTLELPLPFSARLSIEPERLAALTDKDLSKLADALERGLRVMQRQLEKRS